MIRMRSLSHPSKGSDEEDDPTIERCMLFASIWGYTRLCVVNLYAFRAKTPALLIANGYQVGDENDRYIVEKLEESSLVIAA